MNKHYYHVYYFLVKSDTEPTTMVTMSIGSILALWSVIVIFFSFKTRERQPSSALSVGWKVKPWHRVELKMLSVSQRPIPYPGKWADGPTISGVRTGLTLPGVSKQPLETGRYTDVQQTQYRSDCVLLDLRFDTITGSTMGCQLSVVKRPSHNH